MCSRKASPVVRQRPRGRSVREGADQPGTVVAAAAVEPGIPPDRASAADWHRSASPVPAIRSSRSSRLSSLNVTRAGRAPARHAQQRLRSSAIRLSRCGSAHRVAARCAHCADYGRQQMDAGIRRNRSRCRRRGAMSVSTSGDKTISENSAWFSAETACVPAARSSRRVPTLHLASRQRA